MDCNRQSGRPACGLLLPAGVQGGRDASGYRDEGGGGSRSAPFIGDDQREPPQVTHSQPRCGLPAPFLQERLQPTGGSRSLGPCKEVAADLGRGEGRRMGHKLGEGETGRGRRRDGRPSCSRAGPWRNGAGGGAGPREGGKEGEKEEEGKRDEEEKGEEEREARPFDGVLLRVTGRPSGWDDGQAGLQEGPKRPLQRDRPRLKGEGAPACGAQSTASPSKEVQEGQQLGGQRELGHFKEERWPWRGRDSVPAGLKGEAGGNGVPGDPGMPSFVPNAVCAFERNWDRGQTWDSQAMRSGLFPTAIVEKSQWASATGAAKHRDCRGHDGHRQSSRSPRRFDSTIQIVRDDAGRMSLDGSPAVGACPGRGNSPHSERGDGTRQKGHLRRISGEMAERPTGWTRRRIVRQGRWKSKRRREGRKQRWQGSSLGQGRRPKRRAVKEEGGERWQVVGEGDSGKGESRAGALERSMNEASNRTEPGYEGGMALAPRWCSDTEDLGTVIQTGGGPPDHWEQSVHVTAPKWAGENSFGTVEGAKTGALGNAVAALDMTAETFERGPQKVEARALLSGKTLADCGSFLANRLLEVLPLRSQSTGRGSPTCVFPLPTSRSTFLSIDEKMDKREVAWAQCVTLSLNSMWGGPVCHEKEPNDAQQRCLTGIVSEVKRFCGIKDRLEECDWKAFFSIRSIDYRGDEVKVARTFTWSNIAPALPKEIGKVPLAEVCNHGSRHYVLNFDHYLKPRSEWQLRKPPRVMVDDAHWAEVCRGLVSAGVCTYIEESEVFCTDQGPLLNGLFGVTKEETTPEGVEIFRLIMNLIPLNSLCRPMSGDVDTLPAWSGMSPFFIQPSQCLLVSSEDVKCFFYTLSLPSCWVKFLAFNKRVPDHVLPLHLQGRTVYLASLVLPMGFLNSVSLAQHVHRNLALAARGDGAEEPCNAPERELRKDRPFASGSSVWRIYLDNYDLLEKVEATEMVDMQGTCAPGVLALRQEYQRWEVPRNLKKSVERSSKCEVQGATVDGVAGVAYPRETKLAKYFSMALALCEQTRGTQKQWQVICGGLVYFSVFRRPLLGGLNRVWQHIESFESGAPRLTPADCRLEVLRFLGCLPLARLDFRLNMDPMVTCSDASMEGGGICASSGLTPYGALVSQGGLRGEQPENHTDNMVLSVGLFDGIGALRVALDILGAPVIGHVSVEKEAASNRVVESHYPGCTVVACVEDVDEQMVIQWSTRFSQCTIVVLGAGPPCQGVSGLNSDHLGALKDARSSLFAHVPRVRELLKKHFPWCPVYTLMESVASMDAKDRDTMSEAIGCRPLSCNAGTFTWCSRPRLYWIDWEVDEQYVQRPKASGDWSPVQVELRGQQDISQVVRRGWLKVDPDNPFPTFTTSRPQAHPGRKPAGIQQCSWSELERWANDLHRFPPYQYREQHCLVNRDNILRIPDVSEREVMLGFPLNYTLPCLPKNERKGATYNDQRLTLLGNTWSVPVVAWLLGQLLGARGLLPTPSPQQVLDSLQPEGGQLTQGRLVRAPLNAAKGVTQEGQQQLASKLGNLISIKGEDILICAPTNQQVKFHRLRASVPSSLWRWRVIAGWKWTLGKEHINSLELRSILTTMRWRVEHQHHVSVRFVHLTDSLVCLHCLTRGRTSSRKLRRTMSRINALILAANVQPVWGYVHTDQNPADKPSRWHRRVKTKFRNAA